MAVRYVPGVADLEVGGDFYDVLPLPGGAVGLVIGDVMGRGLRAAAVMGQVRAALRAYAQLGLPPAQVLTALDGLVASLDATVVVTATYAVLDVERSLLTVASAGHLPPVLRRPDGRAQLVDVPLGAPLGAGSPSSTATEVTVPDGSTLLLCTDGLVEDRLHDIDEGLAALVAAVEQAPQEAEALVDAVLGALGRAAGHDDDIALLVARTQVRAPVDGLRLPAASSSVPEARRWVAERLAGAEAEQRQVAELLTSELVTNAVLHSGTDLQVRVDGGPEGVRVEVSDGSPALPHRSTNDEELESTTGRGVQLVELLADRWGAEARADGKTVWFELGDPVLPARPAEEKGLAPAAAARTIVVPQVPVDLLLAALRHQDAVLRELVLQTGDAAVPSAAAAPLNALRGILAAGVAAALAPLTSRLGGVYVDVAFVVPATLTADDVFAALDVHHTAERLAARGQLLAQQALPEVTGVLDQVLTEIAVALAAAPSRAPLSDLPPGHVLVAEDHRILAIAPDLEADLGWPGGQLLGQRLSVLVPPRLRSGHIAGFTRVVTTGEARVLGTEVQVAARHHDGREIPAVVTVTRQPAQGAFLGKIVLTG